MNKHIAINNNWLQEFDWLLKDCPECVVCGAEKHLEMCHLIPKEKGGDDTPNNLVLLCHEHHRQAPNTGLSKNIMLNWIKQEAPKYIRGFDMTVDMFKDLEKYGPEFIETCAKRLNINLEEIFDFSSTMMTFMSENITVVTNHSKYNFKNTAISTMKYLLENEDALDEFLQNYSKSQSLL